MQAETAYPGVGKTRAVGLAGLLLTGLAAVGSVWGDSTVLVPSADTSLFAAFPDHNLGGNSNLVSGANGNGLPGRALIRFDLTGQIPTNAQIQSATLQVTVVTLPGGGGVTSIFDLRRVLVDWAEGTGSGNTGSPANDGETTWNNRLHPATPWTVAGGAIPADFAEAVSASAVLDNAGAKAFVSTTSLVADVQGWLLHPAANFGWVLMSEAEGMAFTARRIGSREDTKNSPVLQISYVLPAAPSIQWLTTTNGQTRLSFAASFGQPYTLQYRDSLENGGWQTLVQIPPQATTTNLILLDPLPVHSRRFYRVGAF